MGTPIPNRKVESRSTGSGPLLVTTIDRLDPKTQQELYEKYGIKPKEKVELLLEQFTPDCLTKEKYLELKQAGMTDSGIRKKYGFKFPNDLTNWKKRNGVEGVRLGPTPEQRVNISNSPVQDRQMEEKRQGAVLEHEGEEVDDYLKPSFEKGDREGNPLSGILGKLTYLDVRTEDRETAMQIVKEIESSNIDFKLHKAFGKYFISFIRGENLEK